MHIKKISPLLYLLNITTLFLAGLLYPLYDDSVYYAVVPFLLTLNLAALTGHGQFLHTANKAMASISLLPEIVLALSAFIIFFGSIEMLSRIASDWGFIKYHQPMITMLPPGSEGWRTAHITANDRNVSDPVLWWRPKKTYPYNAQGFRGREVPQKKTSGIFRIMTYGDSNTDGPPHEKGWPEQLQIILDASATSKYTEFQVINAGVSGYTSHQGLLRLRQEIKAYTPDLITVSFGWNDIATASNGSDKYFASPSPLLVSIQKILLKYRSYLILKYFLRRKTQATEKTTTAEPRVALADYLQNMKDFQSLAQSKNIPVLFLTRPHRPTKKEMKEKSGWRNRVPEYNQALVDFGKKNGALVLDIQKFFASNYFVDECHFNVAGHKIMAKYMQNNILPLLGTVTK